VDFFEFELSDFLEEDGDFDFFEIGISTVLVVFIFS